MRHILFISILIFSSFLVSCEKETGVFYWHPYKMEWESSGNDDFQKKYIGEIKNGKPDGMGVFEDPVLDNTYVGEFKDGIFHGQGIYTSSDGYKYVGEYRDGEEWNVIRYDKDGNITGKYVNGKRIKQ